MSIPTVYLSRDAYYDYLSAIEFGRVLEGQPPACWQPLSEDFAFYRRPRGRRILGFHIKDFDEFDVDDPEVAEIWEGPRFAVPLLGLAEATAGEIVVAARSYLGDEHTVNRAYFDMATRLSGERALSAWRCCLEAGDGMAHFAIGYTLFELGRYHEAYAHLRRYCELAPANSWNWCWYGKAAAAIGETGEAREAYCRAITLTARGSDETEALELLAELDDPELRDLSDRR